MHIYPISQKYISAQDNSILKQDVFIKVKKDRNLPVATEPLLIDSNISFPSAMNPHRFGAGPAIYAHALSSVSFKNTY